MLCLSRVSYSYVVQAREKGNRKAKFENFDLVENLDLVENFAVTNFSTKSVDHCIYIIDTPFDTSNQRYLTFPNSREHFHPPHKQLHV